MNRKWYDFTREIRSQNRFFPKSPVINDVKNIIRKLENILKSGTIVYRARIYEEKLEDLSNNIDRVIKSEEFDGLSRVQTINKLKFMPTSDYKQCLLTNIWGYDEKSSGMPPLDKANIGRANPQFLPYFYIAEDDYTAIAEVRPYPTDQVSVAKYKVMKDMKIIDFTGDNGGFRKHLFSDEENELFEHICCLFSIPTRKPDYDYIVSQYISELIKEMGYKGIRFTSSLSPSGVNITTFTQDNFKFISSHVYYIRAITVEVMKHFPHYANEIHHPD